ncbi:MAG: tRNA methyl transferase PRC-barrel domain-containing protein, partial [Bacteroidota bacterium]
EFIATGHYAQINDLNGRKYISKSADLNKDQSYVLWGLSQECMQRSKFPLGPYTKPEVRKMAYDFGYEDLSKKAESFEICFVPDNDYRSFLRRRVDDLDTKVADGNFVTPEGNVLGQHKGYPFYTIGQRRGLGMAFGEPRYVTEIRPDSNTVVLGKVEDLIRNGTNVGKVNLMKYASLPNGLEATTKVRYRDNGTLSELRQDGNSVRVDFLANVSGIAPGQSAVFYEGDDVIGGGIIQSSFNSN